MLKLEPIEFFLRTLPEGFIFILAIYTFSNAKLNVKQYIISSIICAITVFFVRGLPISYGVHTILAMAITISVGVVINKIDVTKVIKSMLIVVVIQFVLEGINIFIIQNIIKVDMNTIFVNPGLKSLYGVPSLVMFMMIIVIYYIIKSRKGKLLDV